MANKWWVFLLHHYFWNLEYLKKKDDKLTKSKNGNVILVSSTAISNFNPLSINPGAII